MGFTLKTHKEDILSRLKSNNKIWQELHIIAKDHQLLTKSYNVISIRTQQLRKEISETNAELFEIKKQKYDFEELVSIQFID